MIRPDVEVLDYFKFDWLQDEDFCYQGGYNLIPNQDESLLMNEVKFRFNLPIDLVGRTYEIKSLVEYSAASAADLTAKKKDAGYNNVTVVNRTFIRMRRMHKEAPTTS